MFTDLKIRVRFLRRWDKTIPTLISRSSRTLKPFALTLSVTIWLLPFGAALAGQVRVVVSNSAYADIARQIGGAIVTVSIADGRRDETSAIQPGSIILCGWAGADEALREAAHRPSLRAILIELPRHASDQSAAVGMPWYATGSMFALAHVYADRLMRLKPDLALQFAGNLAGIRIGFDTIARRIKEIARDYANSEVVAADPLSRGVANKLGFKALGSASTNESGGTISARSFNDLKKAIEERDGSIFLYDDDLRSPEIKRLVSMASQNGVPAVGLQERLPAALRYQQWVLRQWNMVHGALNEAAP
jgi:hypothetical protein